MTTAPRPTARVAVLAPDAPLSPPDGFRISLSAGVQPFKPNWPYIVGIGALVACVVAGAILIALDFGLIGIVVALAAIPIALVAWVVANDRA